MSGHKERALFISKNTAKAYAQRCIIYSVHGATQSRYEAVYRRGQMLGYTVLHRSGPDEPMKPLYEDDLPLFERKASLLH